MPYITSVERIGMRKGMEQGIEQGMQREARRQLLRVLRYRFGDAVTPALEGSLHSLPIADLENLVDVALDASSLEDFRQAIPERDDAAEAPGDQPLEP